MATPGAVDSKKPLATASGPGLTGAELERDVAERVARLRAGFDGGKTRPLAWRRQQLLVLRTLLREREEEALAALAEDLGKPRFEAYAGEVGFLVGEIDHLLGHLDAWARPERVRTPVANFPGRSYVLREPLGVVLVISPWNYPLQLLISPMAGALAAGNTVLLKPSELAPRTSALIARWMRDRFEPDVVQVVEGGVPETTAVLGQRYDHIFFTGSSRVGRIVMEAAARHLTPVTLELGGKSPCIVDSAVDLDVAARRITWGKFFNAGQTCVAPDYVLVHRDLERPLLDRLAATVREFYGEEPRHSPHYARIVNPQHHARLTGFLGDGRAVTGGQHDVGERYIAPTVLTEVTPEKRVMSEEIFGPILPVLPVGDMDEAIRFVNARPKPLALYLFTSDRATQDAVLGRTSSGGACVNDTVAHLSVPGLPFGGVGESGMGGYHGRASFETFSHRKSVLDKATWLDVKLRYPPYMTDLKWVKRLIG